MPKTAKQKSSSISSFGITWMEKNYGERKKRKTEPIIGFYSRSAAVAIIHLMNLYREDPAPGPGLQYPINGFFRADQLPGRGGLMDLHSNLNPDPLGTEPQ